MASCERIISKRTLLQMEYCNIFRDRRCRFEDLASSKRRNGVTFLGRSSSMIVCLACSFTSCLLLLHIVKRRRRFYLVGREASGGIRSRDLLLTRQLSNPVFPKVTNRGRIFALTRLSYRGNFQTAEAIAL